MSEEVSRMAAAAVDDIVKDLCDRCGLRQEWEGIGDEAIYAQIKKSWADIIESHVKPADGYRLPDPIRTTGSCAGCGQPIDNGKDEIFTFESTTGKLWHGHCAPKDEARPIIPPWLREGFWIAIDPKDYNAVMGRFEKPWFRHSDNLVVTEDMGIMFWPCDVHAQRVRWPTDEQGNML